MTRRIPICLLLLAVLILAGACGTARRGEPVTGPHRLADARLEQGQEAFHTYCNTCHPGGTAGLGPAINDKPLPGWLIRFQVRNGLGAMPAFPEEVISGDELDAIIAYLKYLRGLDVDRGALRRGDAGTEG